MEELAGVTAIDCSEGAATVNEVEPDMVPEAAWIVVFPAPVAVAKPVALIVAIVVFVEIQATVPLRFRVLWSLYVPVAVYCCVVPLPIDKFAGVIASDDSVARPC
jgi:hypothetical protein